MDERIRELMARYPALTAAERTELHGLLKERYSYGPLVEFPCSNCGKPLQFTWGLGVACVVDLYEKGGTGCGNPWGKKKRTAEA